MSLEIDKLEELFLRSDKLYQYLSKQNRLCKKNLVLLKMRLKNLTEQNNITNNDIIRVLANELSYNYIYGNMIRAEIRRQEYHDAYLIAVRHNDRKLVADTLIDLMKS